MEEKQPTVDNQKDSLLDKAEAALGQAGEAAGAAFGQVAEKAEEIWENVEDKAEVLMGQAGEVAGKLAEEAKEKLEDVKEGAQNLWNKVTDMIGGKDEDSKS